VAADFFFREIARKKYGPDAKVRDITYFALGGPDCQRPQYRAMIGGQGDGDGVVQGEYVEITVQNTKHRKSDADAA
jgi:hypothetical protein